MPHPQDYQPAPGGEFVAKFGRTAVTLAPDREPRAIYRDGAHVGDWPAPADGWRVIVHGECSGTARTFGAAKALGEALARGSEANYRTFNDSSPRRHALTLADATAEVAATEADRAALMARFPFTLAEQTTLAASRHADVLEPLAPEIVARRIVQLAG